MTNNVVSIKNCILLASLTILSSCVSVSQNSQSDIKMNERIEWCDIWHVDANKNDLPRVLFIGDSITRGYFHKVSKRLKGKAYCSYLCTSSCLGNPILTQQIKLVLSQYKYSVIHFNNGLHGPTYSADQYRKAFEETIELLNKVNDSVIIWGTITPRKHNKGHALVDERNSIANEIVTRYQIPINDLHTPMKGKADYYKDGAHFNSEGVKIQAQQISNMVLKHLNTP